MKIPCFRIKEYVVMRYVLDIPVAAVLFLVVVGVVDHALCSREFRVWVWGVSWCKKVAHAEKQ
jgi:hypothetical protein